MIGSTIWIVPIVAPIVGAMIGAFTCDTMIGAPLKRAQDKQTQDREIETSAAVPR